MKDNIEKYLEIWTHENLLEHTGIYWEGIVEIWRALFWEHIWKLFGSYGNYGNILGACSQNIEGIFGTYGKMTDKP